MVFAVAEARGAPGDVSASRDVEEGLTISVRVIPMEQESAYRSPFPRLLPFLFLDNPDNLSPPHAHLVSRRPWLDVLTPVYDGYHTYSPTWWTREEVKEQVGLT